MKRRVIGGALNAVLLFTAAACWADDQDAIDYRKHVMKSLNEQLAAVNMILNKQAPSDAFAVHMESIAVTATQAKKTFEPKVPGGSSKPDVWANWSDFSKRLDEMVSLTDQLTKTAKSSGPAAVGPKLKPLLDGCQSCHTAYTTSPPKL